MGLTAKGVPKMPMWLTIIRGAAIALSLGALIAAAYNVSLLSSWARYYGGDGPAGLIIFSVNSFPLANIPQDIQLTLPRQSSPGSF
jgi:hypothetical protein